MLYRHRAVLQILWNDVSDVGFKLLHLSHFHFRHKRFSLAYMYGWWGMFVVGDPWTTYYIVFIIYYSYSSVICILTWYNISSEP